MLDSGPPRQGRVRDALGPLLPAWLSSGGAETVGRQLAGLVDPPRYVVALDTLPGHPHDTRLLPVRITERGALPLPFDGPAMLRGLALAHGLAVVPPGGVAAGAAVEVLEVPGG